MLRKLRLRQKNGFLIKKQSVNDGHVDNADNLDIIMPMYNLIEFSDTVIIKTPQEVYGSLKEMNHQ